MTKIMKKMPAVLLAGFMAVIVAFAVGMATVPEVYADDGYETPEIATWSGFRKGAASFTFEDGAPSHVSDAGPMFDKYGYKASFYLVVNWNPDWSGFGNMAKNGHEIGSHSNSHPQNMSGEEASSKINIEGRIQQKYGCITVAYPEGNVPNESAVLQNYIGGRTYNGSWSGESDTMGKDGPTDWAKIPAMTTGPNGSINTTEGFKEQMQNVIRSNGWVVFATWGFQGKNNGNATYSPTDINAIDGALRWAQQNDNDIWVAPLRDVAMYIKERKAAKIEQTASSNGSMTFGLTHSIADNVSNYDYPLSVRVKLPADWGTVKVTQKYAELESIVDDGWIYFDAVPNAGSIVVERTGGPGPISIEGAEVILSADTFTYNSTVQKPTIGTIGGMDLTEGTDYTAEWSNASSTNAGTYSVTITGAGDYTGTASASYTINAKAVTPTVKISNKVYTGKALKPAVTVKAGTKTLKSATDYTVSYKNNTKVGKASAKVTLKGNYKGSKTATFKILPRKAGISKAAPGKKQVIVTMSTKVSATGGTVYQIQYRVKGAAKWKTTTTKSKTKTIKKLKKGKRYQIKVRAYKSVGGTKYYGAWSKVKTTKKIK